MSIAEERYYIASQQQLIWRRFKKHRLALFSCVILIVMYFLAFTYEFWTPYRAITQHQGFVNTPPTAIHFFDSQGNFVALCLMGWITTQPRYIRNAYTEDTNSIHRIRLFTRGEPYHFLGALRRICTF